MINIIRDATASLFSFSNRRNKLSLQQHDEEEAKSILLSPSSSPDSSILESIRTSEEDHPEADQPIYYTAQRQKQKFDWLKLLLISGGSIFIVILIAVIAVHTYPKIVTRISSGFNAAETSSKYTRCNPFLERGHVVNNGDVDKVHWQPLGDECEASNLMTSEFRSSGQATWLDGRNHTIVLIGDSLDRYHVKDFCHLFGLDIEHIVPSHPASPPPYITPGADEETQKKELELGTKEDQNSRPWLCRKKTCSTALSPNGECKGNNGEDTYLNIINFFTYGTDDVGDLYGDGRFFYPPSSFSGRLHHWVLPTLTNLAKYHNDLSFSNPTIVEASSAFWDLKRFSAQDFASTGQNPKAGKFKSFSSIFTDLSNERIKSQEKAVRNIIIDVVSSFLPNGTEVNALGPSMLWRSMSFTSEMNYWVPWPRAYTLDSIIRHTIDKLWKESKNEPKSEAAALRLSDKLRLDEWGRLIEGQGDKLRDKTHPRENPGSVIWIQIILWELRRAIELGHGLSLLAA